MTVINKLHQLAASVLHTKLVEQYREYPETKNQPGMMITRLMMKNIRLIAFIYFLLSHAGEDSGTILAYVAGHHLPALLCLPATDRELIDKGRSEDKQLSYEYVVICYAVADLDLPHKLAVKGVQC